MLILRTLFVVFFSLSMVGPAFAKERKEVAKEHDCTITVGDRDEASATDLIVAECSWTTPMDAVKKVITNHTEHDTYLDSVVPDGRVLQVHQASGIVDRQVSLDFTVTDFEDGGREVSWTRSAKQEPLGEKRVEALVDDGSWIVHPDGKGGSRVTYKLRYGPGGRVPMWIVRSFQVNGIADVLGEMREAAEGLK